jgi:hypothetical protein
MALMDGAKLRHGWLKCKSELWRKVLKVEKLAAYPDIRQHGLHNPQAVLNC